MPCLCTRRETILQKCHTRMGRFMLKRTAHGSRLFGDTVIAGSLVPKTGVSAQSSGILTAAYASKACSRVRPSRGSTTILRAHCCEYQTRAHAHKTHDLTLHSRLHTDVTPDVPSTGRSRCQCATCTHAQYKNMNNLSAS
jgi:hypothetical protein